MTVESAKCCGTCLFWKLDGAVRTVKFGDCRRFPPTDAQEAFAAPKQPGDLILMRTRWPGTNESDLCGEYRPALTMRAYQMPESDKSCEMTPPDPSAVPQVAVSAKSWMRRLADDESLIWVIANPDGIGISAVLTDDEYRGLASQAQGRAWERSRIISLYQMGLIDENGVAIPVGPASP